MNGPRLKHWAAILFPVVVTLILYRKSFRIWFLADDFAWLGLRLSVQSPSDLWQALFSPMAQGTIRTLSERLYFLSFESMFGLESLPMRIGMFLTLAVAEILLVLVVRRLSGSLFTGVLAASLWALNFGLSVAMSWISAYNQVLLSALVLGSLLCFLYYADTNRRGWLLGSWACYLLGFGALENIIALPGILLAWAILFERRRISAALPYFLPAAAFLAAHLWLIPKLKDAPAYRMHFDMALFETLGVYWQWLLAAVKLKNFGPDWNWLEMPVRWILTPAILGFTLWRTLRRDYLPLFGMIISLALLTPVLPLRDHRTDYYLGSAAFGMMIVLATIPLRLPGPARWAGAALLILYIWPSWLVQNATFDWYLARSGSGRVLVRGLQYVVEHHPGKLILVEGVDPALYESVFVDNALRLVHAEGVRIAPDPSLPRNPLTAAPGIVRTAFEQDAILVYRLEGAHLRDVTREWAHNQALSLGNGFSANVLTGDPAYATQFGKGWYQIESGNRWIGRDAHLRLGGPFSTSATLFVKGYTPEALGEAKLTLKVNGEEITTTPIHPGPLQLSFPLPAKFQGQTELEIEFQVSKTFHPPQDNRDLSLVLGQISIR